MRRDEQRKPAIGPRQQARAQIGPARAQFASTRSLRRVLAMIAALAALLPAAAPSARAEARSQATDAAREAVRYLVEREVGRQHRVEVLVGQPDPSWQLAPCTRVEPFVPPALTLWGSTSIGVRCVEGARWSILVPVVVRVFGRALIATGAMSAGSSPSAGDFRVEEVDLTREVAPVVGDTAALKGQRLTRSLAAGQPFRLDTLRAAGPDHSSEPAKDISFGRTFANIANASR